MPFDLSNKIDHKVLGKSENLPPNPIDEENTYDIRQLKCLRNQNPCRVIIGHININSKRNKFQSFVKYVDNNLHIDMVSATKVDDTFPESQFLIENFPTPHRLDGTAKSRGILLYIKQNYHLNI